MEEYFKKKDELNNKILENEETVINNYLKLIEDGNIGSINNLANYYLEIKNYTMVKKYYQMGIDLNYLECIINFGDYYRDIENDYSEMKKIYNIGIDKNNTKCMLRMGNYYNDIEINFSEMEKYYYMAFNQGDIEGMYQLAIYFKYSEKKNYNKMKKYFKLAVDQGCNESMYELGHYYQEINKNYKLMKKYYNDAILEKNTKAMFSLGCYYEKVEFDINMALECYLNGSEFDNEECIYALACYYKNIKDIDNMIIYYKKLITYKNSEAFYEIARYYLLREKNTEMAELCVEEAFHLGYDKKNTANFILSIFLIKNELDGNNIMEEINIDNIKIDKNEIMDTAEFDKFESLEEKFEFLKKRADKGDTGSMVFVGYYYITNLKDYVNGFKYLYMMLDYIKMDNNDFGFDDKIYEETFKEIAEKENNIDSMLFLGLYYLQHDNDKLAEKYLLKSFKNKNIKACDYLYFLYAKKSNILKMMKYLKISVEYGSSTGYCGMGLQCYILDDHELAKKYFLKAIEKGNLFGLYYLGKYYYLLAENNISMMKKCLKLVVKYSGDIESKEFLLNHYSFIECNKIQSKKYKLLLYLSGDSMTCFQEPKIDPYIYDHDDTECNYILSKDKKIIQVNTKNGIIKELIFDDDDENYCEYKTFAVRK